MQAPGRPDKDRRGGFEHGGWAHAGNAEVMGRVMIHPLVLGSGRRLFPDGGPKSALRLVDSVTTTTGVVIATYRPA
jgi:RibD C-terminal domain